MPSATNTTDCDVAVLGMGTSEEDAALRVPTRLLRSAV